MHVQCDWRLWGYLCEGVSVHFGGCTGKELLEVLQEQSMGKGVGNRRLGCVWPDKRRGELSG